MRNLAVIVIAVIAATITATLLFPDRPAPADPKLAAIRIHAETRYTIREERRFRGPRHHEVAMRTSGTGFLVEHGGSVFVATAAHVLSGPPRPTHVTLESAHEVEIDDYWYHVEGFGYRVRISGLSLKPQSVYIDRAHDVAVMALTPEAESKLSEWVRYRVAARPASPNDTVRAWGFAEDSLPLPLDAVVASVRPEFFTVNHRLEGGFSGGPILNGAGKIVGLINRSTQRQARCAARTVIADALRAARTQASDYHDTVPTLQDGG